MHMAYLNPLSTSKFILFLKYQGDRPPPPLYNLTEPQANFCWGVFILDTFNLMFHDLYVKLTNIVNEHICLSLFLDGGVESNCFF